MSTINIRPSQSSITQRLMIPVDFPRDRRMGALRDTMPSRDATAASTSISGE